MRCQIETIMDQMACLHIVSWLALHGPSKRGKRPEEAFEEGLEELGKFWILSKEAFKHWFQFAWGDLTAEIPRDGWRWVVHLLVGGWLTEPGNEAPLVGKEEDGFRSWRWSVCVCTLTADWWLNPGQEHAQAIGGQRIRWEGLHKMHSDG